MIGPKAVLGRVEAGTRVRDGVREATERSLRNHGVVILEPAMDAR